MSSRSDNNRLDAAIGVISTYVMQRWLAIQATPLFVGHAVHDLRAGLLSTIPSSWPCDRLDVAMTSIHALYLLTSCPNSQSEPNSR